jgi:hypothetical protein
MSELYYSSFLFPIQFVARFTGSGKKGRKLAINFVDSLAIFRFCFFDCKIWGLGVFCFWGVFVF